ncbi:unnamed protein product [Arabidopsis halleri]
MGKRQKQVTHRINSRRENSKEIPIDLLIDIFSRLSMADIARCRCVSKLWSSVPRLRYFTELFLKISSARPRILFTFPHNGKRIFYSISQHLHSEPSPFPFVPYYHMSFPKGKGSSYDYEILAPVRGFLCSKASKPMIYNPSTGECKTLPRAMTKRTEMKTYFGYDPIDKLFKVFCVSKVLLASEDFACRVSTLGTGEVYWRMIECSIPHRPLRGEICIDGVLYYVAECIGNKIPECYMVVCFDVRSEKFKFLVVEFIFWCSTLINCKGKLGVLWSVPFGLTHELTKYFVLWIL